jgi:hypothetical protein
MTEVCAMQMPQMAAPRRLEPEFLGSLQEAGLDATGPHDLFPGEGDYLGKGALKKRTALWSKVAPHVEPMLQENERVLYMAPAVGKVGILQYLGMGWLAFAYNQVALVFTDVRLIEVQLDFHGRKPEERIRSFPWSGATSFRYRLGSLTLAPPQGKKATWSLRIRGDKKVLKQLAPRIGERLLTSGTAAGGPLPVQHCSSCHAALPGKVGQCPACGALFRSGKLAAALSLAFPGAGLLYAGHPVLAFFDFLGEGLVFLFVALALASETTLSGVAVLVLLGMFLMILTKLESLHIGHILVARTRTETPQRRDRFRKIALGGGLISVLALVAALAVTGRFAPMIERDLDFAALSPEWSGTRSSLEWEQFIDDPALRSQWFHEEGWTVSVFTYDVSDSSLEAFRDEFIKEAGFQGEVVTMDSDVPEPYLGFRAIQELSDQDQEHYSFINYFVYDDEGADIHQLLSVVPAELSGEGESHVRELLEGAEWIDAVAPTM